MSESSDSQSLTSKVIKILRITNEPLSAHAISDLYHLPYNRVKTILKGLEEDNLVYSLKTKRGTFYFIPDRYLKRDGDLIASEDVMPYLWYEELSDEELRVRKETIVKSIENLKKKFKAKKVPAPEYFSNLQKKNEELAILTQIVIDRKEKRTKSCFYCGVELQDNTAKCQECNKEQPECSVCKRKIYANESVAQCPQCHALSHEVHIKEWLKSIGQCPKCKQKILDSELILK